MVYESESRTMKISMPKAFLDELEKLSDELDTGISRLLQYTVLEWLGKEDYLGEKFQRLYSRFKSLVGMLETEAEEVKASIGDFLPLIEKYGEEMVSVPTAEIPEEILEEWEKVREELELERGETYTLLFAIAFNQTSGIVNEEDITEKEEEQEVEEE